MDMHSLMPQQRPRLKPCCKNKKQWLDGTLDTTYRDDFVGKEVPVERAARRHDGYNIFGNKFDGTTTNSADFKPYAVKREALIRPTNTDLSNGLTFAGDSTYKQDFAAKEVPYVLVKPQHAFAPNTAPFESVTTHKSDFQPREVPAPAKAITHGTNIPASAGPFAGQSLYKETFQKQPFARVQPVVPSITSGVLPSGQFDDNTLYRSTFVPKEVSRPELCRPKDGRPQSRQGWYGGAPATEYGGQFVGKEGPAQQPIKMPQSMGVLPSGAFNGSTISRSDYVPYATAGATRIIRPTPAFETDRLPFQGQSTYQSNFIPQEVAYERVRPKNGFERNTAPFEGTTTHRAAFIPMEVPAVLRAGARAGTLKPDGHPFEGSSTYKGDFTKMPGARRGKILPKESEHPHAPFDGTTTYNQDFIEKEVPARYIRRRDDECESCVDGIPGVTCLDVM